MNALAAPVQLDWSDTMLLPEACVWYTRMSFNTSAGCTLYWRPRWVSWFCYEIMLLWCSRLSWLHYSCPGERAVLWPPCQPGERVCSP